MSNQRTFTIDGTEYEIAQKRDGEILLQETPNKADEIASIITNRAPSDISAKASSYANGVAVDITRVYGGEPKLGSRLAGFIYTEMGVVISGIMVLSEEKVRVWFRERGEFLDKADTEQ